MPSQLYHIEALEEVIETVLFTSFIRDENPVSIIIVGPSGIGKSMMLSRYESEQFRRTDSISSMGLFDISVRDSKNEIKFLLMPDMNPTLSRKPSTVQSTIANLLSFTADGTVRIDDGRANKECKHAPVGLITAATDDIYNKQAYKWYALGLRRRIIPIFFKYSTDTTQKLQTLVSKDKVHSTPPELKKLMPPQKVRPGIPSSIMPKIEGLAMRFSTLLGKLYSMDHHNMKKWHVRDVVPIAPQITLTTLLRAHALKNKRATATQEDFAFICRFLDFCDPEHPREI